MHFMMQTKSTCQFGFSINLVILMIGIKHTHVEAICIRKEMSKSLKDLQIVCKRIQQTGDFAIERWLYLWRRSEVWLIANGAIKRDILHFSAFVKFRLNLRRIVFRFDSHWTHWRRSAISIHNLRKNLFPNPFFSERVEPIFNLFILNGGDTTLTLWNFNSAYVILLKLWNLIILKMFFHKD